MKFLVAALVLSSCARAATVQGIIFDEETSIPIARTQVALIPLPGTSGTPQSLLATENGRYAFSGVTAGWYLVRASRIGFETGEFGQSHPGLPGVPFEITDQSSDSELRQIVMRRQAAISGTVVDDNAIGIPDWPVSIYTARTPVRRVAEAKTDDRGNFRVGELEAGTYVVRAGGGDLDGVSTLVPSYYKYGTALAGAESMHVHLGETQNFVIVHTVEGQLFELSGEVTAPDKRPVRVTLITDTGRRGIANATGPFAASDVPPGLVEGILAEGAGCGSYQTLIVDRNMTIHADCTPLGIPTFTGAQSYPLIARREDLDGPGPETIVSANQQLSPGPWEFTVRPDVAQYLVSVANAGSTAPPSTAFEGWFGVDVGNAPNLRVTLSPKPASISGVVTSSSKAVVGAPVFLQLMNPTVPELPVQSWNVRADPQGKFIFSSLGPGTYRVMSSFDVDYEDPLARDKASMVTLREGEAVTQPLEMLRQ